MKKTSLLLVASSIAALLTSQLGHAKDNEGSVKGNFYLGLDALSSDAKHKWSNVAYGSNTTPPAHDISIRNDSRGYGLNGGYRITANQRYYVSPEIFYERLGSKAQDFYHDDPSFPAPYDSLSLKYRYGAKVNLGYNITDSLGVFVNAGVTKIAYRNHLPSITAFRNEFPADDSMKTAPIFGLGVVFNINSHWGIKLSGDMQKFSTRYLDNGLRDSVSIKTAKLGVVYNF